MLGYFKKLGLGIKLQYNPAEDALGMMGMRGNIPKAEAGRRTSAIAEE